MLFLALTNDYPYNLFAWFGFAVYVAHVVTKGKYLSISGMGMIILTVLLGISAYHNFVATETSLIELLVIFAIATVLGVSMFWLQARLCRNSP